jgi:hypothetical protein
MPTQELADRLGEARVKGVHTDARLKEDAFGRIKALLQQGRLQLPRHPALLRQLSALEYEERDSCSLHIAVPDHVGHDDLAMALALAVHGDPTIGTSRQRKHRKLRFRGYIPAVEQQIWSRTIVTPNSSAAAQQLVSALA